MVDLEIYKTKWKTGYNGWGIGADLIEEPPSDSELDSPSHKTPVMTHQTLQLKRPSAKSYELEAEAEKGRAIVQFDGGAAQSLGTGGFLIWEATGKLISA
jgi:hypothetical protein